MITEPMTMATDYLIGIFCVWACFKLSRSQIHQGHKSRRFWALTFLTLAVGAFAGGSKHGFDQLFDPQLLDHLWLLTLVSIGFVSFFIWGTTVFSNFSISSQQGWLVFAAIKLAVYTWWISNHREFIWVILDYLPALLVVLAVNARAWAKFSRPNSPWIVGGVVVSLLAAAIQVSKIGFHQHFNHNDLYHVVQLGGLYLFYRGALITRDINEPKFAA